MGSIDFAAAERYVFLREVLELLRWKSHSEEPTRDRGPCPIHSFEDHKSRIFSVSGEKWWCNKCKVGGGPLQLYALATRQPIYGATKELFRRLGRALPYKPRQAENRRPRTRNREEE
jgi:hypothetical protein